MKRAFIFLLSSIFILILILFLVENAKYGIKEVTSSNIKEIVENYDYVFITYGKPKKSLKKFAKSFKKDYRVSTYYTYLTKENLEEIFSIVLNNNEQILFVEGQYKNTISSSSKYETYKNFFDENIYNKISEIDKYYKVAENAKEYLDLVKSKNYTVAVIGYEGCSYCNLYLPVFNKVAKEHNISIYYFDADNYDEDEYQKVIGLDFEIPAKCNTKGEVKTMTEGFAKPMTLITKDGKLVDCIKGYVKESVLVDTLSKYKIIKKGSIKNVSK